MNALRPRFPSRSLRILIPFVLLLFAVLFLPLPASAEGDTKVIHLDASQYEYTPGRVQVNQGDHVVIEVIASDVVHGFYLDGYGIQERIQPGITKRIEFVANKPGKFRFRCSVTCGPIHPFMIGELIVGPNIPFWRTAGAMIVAAAGMLTYLWITRDKAQFQERANESI